MRSFVRSRLRRVGFEEHLPLVAHLDELRKTVPLYLLFELSLVVASVADRRAERQAAGSR